MTNFGQRPDARPTTSGETAHDLAAARFDGRAAEWDWEDIHGGRWRIDREPREGGRLAIKSGPFTILTVGDYFDGGGPVEERLRWICDRANEAIEALRVVR